MFKKSLIAIAAVLLLAMPATTFASGTLASEVVPVMMLIDKTVTLDLDPAEILLNQMDGKSWQGQTTVHMTNNFRVTVHADIFPFGPAIAPNISNDYKVALAPFGVAPFAWQKGTDWWDLPAAPAPVGQMFLLGARINNVDISLVLSDLAPQQVAQILLTVVDNL